MQVAVDSNGKIYEVGSMTVGKVENELVARSLKSLCTKWTDIIRIPCQSAGDFFIINNRFFNIWHYPLIMV